jgi:type I restriction enzyme R subunit
MSLTEADTRRQFIDTALAAAGWGQNGSKIHCEFQITRGRIQAGGKRAPAQIADYVLEYRDHKLAVIEAKKFDLHHTEGLAQAKTYSQKMGVRFAFATNGQKIYSVDMETAHEGDIESYPTPDELWEMVFSQQNAWHAAFSAIPYEDKGGLWQPRYYQQIAVVRVLNAISRGDSRILLTLATGTGKTAIAFQIAWKLFQSRWNLSGKPTRRPRILFLADRNILADQAYNAFGAFPEDAMVRMRPGDVRKKGVVPKNGSVFFTIFQSFMTESTGEPNFGQYPPDFFDFIVIDECHRGGANDESTWRGILDYFTPAVQLGLTATPRRDINIDTYEYFGDPVFVYSLKEGIL